MPRRWLPLGYAFALACGSSEDLASEPPPERGTDAGVRDGSSETDGPAPSLDAGPEDPGASTPYNRAVQKSAHNAYERFEPLFDQLVWHRIRSLEIDLHVAKSGASTRNGDWFVYHDDQPLFRDSSCTRLSDCLSQVAAFHAAVPKHEVITLWVDLKSDFTANHTPADLDAALVRGLGRSAIVAPKDLVAKCAGSATLRGAVSTVCKFPALAELRGKVMVTVTGGTACDASSKISAYGGAQPLDRLAFLAPNIDATCDAASYDAISSVVFLNMSYDERARAADVKSRGLVGRVYRGGLPGGLDSAGDFDTARTAGAQHLASDKINAEQDGWATTASALGFPFECDDCAPPRVEVASLLGLRAVSGDIAGTADSFYFASEDDPSTLPVTWSAFVSVPSSHVDELAKTCLMARAGDSPNAANVALCRTFDKHGPVFQVRASDGAMTTSTELPAIDGFTVEAPAFLRLTLTPNGATTDARAEASVDGKFWSIVGQTSAPKLPLRGVAISSHGTTRVKGLLGNVVRKRGTEALTYRVANFPARRPIGAGASGDAFDGAAP